MPRQQNHKDFGGHANLPPGHQLFAENTRGSKTTQWRRRRWPLLTQHSSLASPTFVLSPLCRSSFGLPMIGRNHCQVFFCLQVYILYVCPMSYIFHFRISPTSLNQPRSERAPLSIDSQNCIKHLHPIHGWTRYGHSFTCRAGKDLPDIIGTCTGFIVLWTYEVWDVNNMFIF
jgi:hypothetical protein